MLWKALKYFNTMFYKDSSNKEKYLNWILRRTLMVKLTKKLCGERQEGALLKMFHVASKNN